MKKEYSKPQLKIETFSSEDVMLVSSIEPFSTANLSGIGGFDDDD